MTAILRTRPARPLVLVAAGRGGDVVPKVIPTHHGKAAIAAALDGVVEANATVMTDGLPAYRRIGKTQPPLAVNHSTREYARTDRVTGQRVHVNRVESFNGFMRRAVIGVFHSISVKRLGRYTGEGYSVPDPVDGAPPPTRV